MYIFVPSLLATFVAVVSALRYDPQQVDYNLNTNQAATNPLDYSGTWAGHTYFPSPTNWRFPFYALFLDRFVNGDPTNDNINGTIFEQDLLSTQYRHGGDVAGLVESLDYLQGMGIKVRSLFITGRRILTESYRPSTSPVARSSTSLGLQTPTRRSTLPCSTTTSAISHNGALPSTRYTAVACTLCWTIRMLPWET